MDAAQLQLFWKVLLIFLSASQAVSAAGYLVGRWQQKQEGTSGNQADNLKRVEREVAELRQWRHEVAHDEIKDVTTLYRGFVSRDEFNVFMQDRRDETTRIWAELARLRNGKH